MLVLKKVNCRYDKVLVIKDVYLHIENGEILGLLGRNGDGKSKTLKTIIGLVKTNSGRI